VSHIAVAKPATTMPLLEPKGRHKTAGVYRPGWCRGSEADFGAGAVTRDAGRTRHLGFRSVQKMPTIDASSGFIRGILAMDAMIAGTDPS
jgi:hypothetical protein